MTLHKLTGLSICVLLCAAITAAQTPPTAQEKEPPPESVAEPAPQHAPNPEALAAYQEGTAAFRRQDLARAAQAFESAVKLDPDFAPAWNSLGRVRMALRQRPEAEAAFRRYLELSPDDPDALEDLATALIAEKKYNDGIELLRKLLTLQPENGEVYQRIGDAYLRMNQPESAIPELEKAASLMPQQWGPPYQVAQACMRLHQYDKAAASFDRAFTLNSVFGRMNDAAYEFAAAKVHLDLAEKWATQIVQGVELELARVKLPLESLDLQRASMLAGFWDTLGWVKFQEGDLATAEKYVAAGSQFVADSAGPKHLGDIYEAQQRPADAEEAYAESLALAPATREPNDDEKQARRQLSRLLGNESLIDDRVKQARVNMEARRNVLILNPSLARGLVQYVVIIGPGSKITDMQPMSPDDPLSPLKDAVRSVKVPQSFPDDTTLKLPRTATLSCPREDSPCQFTLLPVGWGVRIQSLISAPSQSP